MSAPSALVEAVLGWSYVSGQPLRDEDSIREAARAGTLASQADCSGLVFAICACSTPEGFALPAFGRVAEMADMLPELAEPGPGWTLFLNDQDRGKWHHCGFYWAGGDGLEAGYLHASSGRGQVVYDRSLPGKISWRSLKEVLGA